MAAVNELSFPRGRLDNAVAMAWHAFERSGRDLESWLGTLKPVACYPSVFTLWQSSSRRATGGANPIDDLVDRAPAATADETLELY